MSQQWDGDRRRLQITVDVPENVNLTLIAHALMVLGDVATVNTEATGDLVEEMKTINAELTRYREAKR